MACATFTPEVQHGFVEPTDELSDLNLDMEDKYQVIEYLKNGTVRRYVMRVKGVDEETVLQNLRELLGIMPKEELFEHDEVLGKWKLTPLLQDFSKEFLYGVYHQEENIDTTISADDTVFGANYAGMCNISEMLKGLAHLIMDIIETFKLGDDDVTYYVQDFLSRLTKHPIPRVGCLISHPSLKRKGEILEFLRNCWVAISENKLAGLREAEKNRYQVYHNYWKSIVERDGLLNGILIHEQSIHNKVYCNTLTELIFYVRDVKVHLNLIEEVIPCLAQEASEAASTSTHSGTVNDSPIQRGVCSDMGIELLFQKYFPALATHLHEYTVILP